MVSVEQKVENAMRTAYNKTHFSRNLLALYFGRVIMRISFGMLGVFMPIFFYTKFGLDIQTVIYIYIIQFGLVFLITPITARLLSVLGTRSMIILAILFASASIGSLYFFDINPLYATLAYVASMAIYKALYWVPYHVDLAQFLDPSMRGRQLAILRNIASVLLVIIPAVGGVLIARLGFQSVFLLSVILMVISVIPLWFLGNSYERFSWKYIQTFKHLFARGNRRLFLAHSAGGVQGITTVVFWPIYIYMLLDQRLTVVGFISSLTIVAVIIIRYIAGKYFDTWDHKRVLTVGVILASTGWIFKLFVQTPFQVFVADSYHNFGRTVNSLSFDATTYEQSADNGTYIDEYTALKEMSLALGRIVMLVAMLFLLAIFSIKVAFAIAATVALVMIILNKPTKIA